MPKARSPFFSHLNTTQIAMQEPCTIAREDSGALKIMDSARRHMSRCADFLGGQAPAFGLAVVLLPAKTPDAQALFRPLKLCSMKRSVFLL
jgi:hypothetical protein